MKNDSGFVAGTMVHTDRGLIPIQDIKVGDLVLSQPKWGVEESYKPVISTVRSDERKEIYALRYIDNFTNPDPNEFFRHGMSLSEFDNSILKSLRRIIQFGCLKMSMRRFHLDGILLLRCQVTNKSYFKEEMRLEG